MAGPQAWIDAPQHDSQHLVAPMEIVLHAADPGGVAMIELSVNGEILSRRAPEDTAAPLVTFRVLWDPSEAGLYHLSAQAQSHGGAWGALTSSDVTLIWPEVLVTSSPVVTTAPLTPTPTATLAITPTSTPPAQASIEVVRISTDVVAYEGGPGCAPMEVSILVRATDPVGVTAVVLFYRLSNKESGETTDYFSGAMVPQGGDLYSITVNPAEDIINQVGFPGSGEAWLQYQAVLQNAQGDTSTRTPLLSDITVLGC
jgi:hypothetical protein